MCTQIIIISYDMYVFISVSLLEEDTFVCNCICFCHLIHLQNCQNLLIHLFVDEQYISMEKEFFCLQKGCVCIYACVNVCIQNIIQGYERILRNHTHTFHVFWLWSFVYTMFEYNKIDDAICVCAHSYHFHLFGCIPNTPQYYAIYGVFLKYLLTT